MSKIVISEENLDRIIKEAILEAIDEKMGFGEWLGNAAGNAYQWGRNQIANLQKGFTAGRLHQRANNVNFNPLSRYREKYGDQHVRDMLAQRGDRYGRNRYDVMSKAWNGTGVKPPTAHPETTASAPEGGNATKITDMIKNGNLSQEDIQQINAAIKEYQKSHAGVKEERIRKIISEEITKLKNPKK